MFTTHNTGYTQNEIDELNAEFERRFQAVGYLTGRRHVGIGYSEAFKQFAIEVSRRPESKFIHQSCLNMRREICEKFGRDKIIGSVKFVGWPDYHVKGTRVVYCGSCDIPPAMVLDNVTKRVYRMELDPCR